MLIHISIFISKFEVSVNFSFGLHDENHPNI